jgi:hypothetical protein
MSHLSQQLQDIGVDLQSAEICSRLFDTAAEVTRGSRSFGHAVRSSPTAQLLHLQALQYLGHEPQGGPGGITLHAFRR